MVLGSIEKIPLSTRKAISSAEGHCCVPKVPASHYFPRSTRNVQKVSTLSHFLNGILPLQCTLLLHIFTPLHLHSSYHDPWSVNKPEKSVKEVSHSSTLLYSGVWNQCQWVANKWPLLVDLGWLPQDLHCCLSHQRGGSPLIFEGGNGGLQLYAFENQLFYVIFFKMSLRKKVEPNWCLRGAVLENGSSLQRGSIFSVK